MRTELGCIYSNLLCPKTGRECPNEPALAGDIAFPKTNRCDRLQAALNEHEGLLSTVEVPASATFLNTGQCAFALFGAWIPRILAHTP